MIFSVLQPETSSAFQLMAPIQQQIEGVIQRNQALLPLAPDTQFPHFLSFHHLMKLHRIQAEDAMQRRDWSAALRHLKASAEVGNPIRWQYLIGHLIALSTRAIAYGGYHALARANPPPEFARQALADLEALKSSEPVMDKWVGYAEQLLLIIEMRRPPLKGSHGAQIAEPSARLVKQDYYQIAFWRTVASILAQRERLRDPALRRWADYLWHKNEDKFRAGMLFTGSLEPMQWTWMPAARRWLREVIEREPWVLATYDFSPEELKQLDPWTLVNVLGGFGGAVPATTILDAQTRTQSMHESGILARAALQARLHQQQHASWPADIEQLARSLALTTTETLNAGWVELNDPNTKAALWGEQLPLRQIWPNYYAKSDGISATGQIDLTSDWQGDARRPLIYAKALQAHPGLVDDAAAGMAMNNWPTTGPLARAPKLDWPPLNGSNAPAEEWRELTDEIARDLTSHSLMVSENGSMLQVMLTAPPLGPALSPAPPAMPGMMMPLPVPPAPPRKAPASIWIRLRAKLKTPEKAWALWMPGPDWNDDAGRIAYDPTNGTTSRGDRVVFPESF